MRIALIIDNTFRDLPGMVLLAARLCQRGATCALVPMGLRDQQIWSMAPDFVLLNYLRKRNEGFARELLAAGIQIGVLDTEGGVLRSLEHYGKIMAGDKAIRDAVSVFCSWGPRLAEHVCREGWYRSGQVVVTGAPRMDLYAAPWYEAVLQTSPYVDRYAQPLILINSNFPLGNSFSGANAERKVEAYRLYGVSPEQVLAWEHTAQQALQHMVGLVNRLARRFPQANFIYRPHPFEKLDTYRTLLDARDNLHLVKQGSVSGWILRAKAVLQRSCSTSIEAALAGVPALCPSWIPTATATESTDAVSIAFPTEDDLTAALDRILQGQFTMPAATTESLQCVIADWFHAVDGHSHERVADAICERVRPGGVNRTACWARVGSPWVKRMRGLLRWLPGLRKSSDQSASTPVAAEKLFDAAAVREWVDAFAQCSDLETDIRTDKNVVTLTANALASRAA